MVRKNYSSMENNTSTQPSAPAEDWQLTIERLFKDKPFDSKQLSSPFWLSDNNRLSYIDRIPDSESNGIWLYDCNLQSRELLTPPATLLVQPEGTDEPKPLSIPGYQWSPDETRLLFATVPARRSTRGDDRLYIYDVELRELICITPTKGEYRCARWSPDGASVGFVRGNDIWVVHLADLREIQCTFTGDRLLYNGVFGWVYEEELDMVAGWDWSPCGRKIAFFETNETSVPEILITDFAKHDLSPQSTRYPQAGDCNPAVRVGIVMLDEPMLPTRWLNTGSDSSCYLTSLQWLPSSDLLLQRSPRLQQKIELLRYAGGSTDPEILLTETDKCWLTPHGKVTLNDRTEQLLWLSSRDGYTHIYQYSLNGGAPLQITSGEWEVDSILGIDSANNAVIFAAALPNPMSRTIFRAPLDVPGPCSLISAAHGTTNAVPSPDGSRMIQVHSDMHTPHRTILTDGNGVEQATLLESPMPFLEKFVMARGEFLQIPGADGTPLNAIVVKPRNFDAGRKYSVLMYTYGGPASQVVQDNWGNATGGLAQLLAEQEVVTVRVDNRGTGMRGREFRTSTYKRMGILESDDQIAAARWIASQQWADPARIGIWGWSYGGFMAALCILRGADVFCTAVSGAPVTDWHYYDSIYTERYMQMPEDNPEGYAETSPVELAHQLKGNLLLIHGTADDNVHYRNSMMLAAKLQSLNLPFEMMTYPHCKHGLGAVTRHFYEIMMRYLQRTLIEPRN